MDDLTNVQKRITGISLRLLIVIVIFLVSLFAFGFIADEMVLEKENRFDTIVFEKLHAITSPAVTHFMSSITFLGSNAFLLPAYIGLILFFWVLKRNPRLSLNIASIGITSTIVLYTLKYIFHRHRPSDPLIQNVLGFSFPSGHSFSSFTLFGLLIYILWKQKINVAWRWILSILFFLLACVVAFSRVYLHVHYASDVLAGFFLCLVWLIISFWALNNLNKTFPERTG